MPDDDPTEPGTDGSVTTEPEATGTANSKPDEAFVSFLKKHGISGDKFLEILKRLRSHPVVRSQEYHGRPGSPGATEEKFRDYPVVVKSLGAISVEAIDNTTAGPKRFPGKNVLLINPLG